MHRQAITALRVQAELNNCLVGMDVDTDDRQCLPCQCLFTLLPPFSGFNLEVLNLIFPKKIRASRGRATVPAGHTVPVHHRLITHSPAPPQAGPHDSADA